MKRAHLTIQSSLMQHQLLHPPIGGLGDIDQVFRWTCERVGAPGFDPAMTTGIESRHAYEQADTRRREERKRRRDPVQILDCFAFARNDGVVPRMLRSTARWRRGALLIRGPLFEYGFRLSVATTMARRRRA
jgi:hypothetical protein